MKRVAVGLKVGDCREQEFDAPTAGRIPHPRECLPRRPARVPTYEPRRDRRDAGRRPLPRGALEGWHSPRLVASPNLGHMRVNFNYRNYFTTAAGYGEKPRRAQYFEGPYELALFRFLEMSTRIVDYQFQPLQIQWETSSGQTVSYTTDVIYATETAEIGVEEVKATNAYFEQAETHDLLALFEAEIEKEGARFYRRNGRHLVDRAIWRTVKDAFDDRRTAYSDQDVERVREVIVREGGAAPLGPIVDGLHVSSRQGLAMLNAMMVQRLVGFDLVRPPTADTIVTIPPAAADPNALRSFLRRYATTA